MNSISGFNNMNITPINNYNNYLNGAKAFEVDSSGDFDDILNQQTSAMQNSFKVQGGVEMNNIDDVVARNSVQQIDEASPTGNFLDSVSKSIGGGINSVNNSVEAANKAQEAMAMGEDVSVHDVMIASEKATLSLQMGMQLRNKLLSAYSEINNVKV
jgi:flagellar hook-basal body complex protein FliE